MPNFPTGVEPDCRVLPTCIALPGGEPGVTCHLASLAQQDGGDASVVVAAGAGPPTETKEVGGGENG